MVAIYGKQLHCYVIIAAWLYQRNYNHFFCAYTVPKNQSEVGELDDKKTRKDDKSSPAESTNGLYTVHTWIQSTSEF